MLLRISCLFLYATISAFAHVIDPRANNAPPPANPDLTIEMCGTPPPSDGLRAAHAFYRGDPNARMAQLNGNSPLIIEVYMHFVSTADQAPLYNGATRSTLMSNQVSCGNSHPPL